jgi:hypothetical protein
MDLRPKFTAPNRTSKQNRCPEASMSPKDVVETWQLAEDMDEILGIIACYDMDDEPVDPAYLEYYLELEALYNELTLYAPRKRHARTTHADYDVAYALEVRRNDTAKFMEDFAFHPSLVREVAPLLFPEGTMPQRMKQWSPEASMLLLLNRGKVLCTRQTCFGVCYEGHDVDDLNKRISVMIAQVDVVANERLSAGRLVDFEDEMPSFARALDMALKRGMQLKNDPGFNEVMQAIITSAPHFLFDGVRQEIRRPSDKNISELFYTKYKKQFGKLYGGLIGPSGLILVLNGPFEGCCNDKYLQNVELEEALQAVNGVVLCDGAFTRSDDMWIPIPDKRTCKDVLGINKRDTASLSHARVPVEWGFGQVEAMFPWVFSGRLKLSGSQYTPAMVMRVYVLLYNLFILEQGTNATKYFGIIAEHTPTSYLEQVL